MADFTAVGHNITLSMADKGESVAIALSGTYNMTIAFQREMGSPGSGAWETLRTYTTEDATVAETHITEKVGEELRLIVLADTDGTAVNSLTDSAKEGQPGLTRRDRVGNVVQEHNQGGVQFPGSFRAGEPINVTAATLVLTEAVHAGRLIVLNRAAGITVTLPVSTGKGAVYRFFTETGNTTNDNIIQVTSTEIMQGMLFIQDSGDATMSGFQTASTADSMISNGGTEGGNRGDYVEIEDVAVGLFRVSGWLIGGATQVSPFGATRS